MGDFQLAFTELHHLQAVRFYPVTEKITHEIKAVIRIGVHPDVDGPALPVFNHLKPGRNVLQGHRLTVPTIHVTTIEMWMPDSGTQRLLSLQHIRNFSIVGVVVFIVLADGRTDLQIRSAQVIKVLQFFLQPLERHLAPLGPGSLLVALLLAWLQCREAAFTLYPPDHATIGRRLIPALLALTPVIRCDPVQGCQILLPAVFRLVERNQPLPQVTFISIADPACIDTQPLQ